MSPRGFALAAFVTALATMAMMRAWSSAQSAGEVKLENAKVRVREVVYEPGVPRERHIRPTDQIIVFLEDCEYERTDPDTGEKTIRRRRAGEVIWHDRGEVAPVLVNRAGKAYRTLLIEWKER